MTMTLETQPAEPGGALTDPACPDVYYTAGYGRAAAIAETGVWQLAHREDRILLPYLLRDAGGAVDAISPYGYSGLWLAPGVSRADLARFWALALDGWRERGVVSLFLRFSPLDPGAVDAVRELAAVELVHRTDTVTVPVGHGSSQVWDGMQGRARTMIRKARNAGLEGQLRPAGPDDVVAGSAFRRLYEQTMLRVGSAPGYLFPEPYYRRLADGLDKNLLVAEVRDRDRAHYHLAGSEPQHARLGANNLLVWTILQWATQSGCARVHLGGGMRPDDGLFTFKRSFGGARTAYWTGSVVIDQPGYDALLAARARSLGTSVARLRETTYFPAYRAR
jgi:hypothetical protein